MDEGVAVRRRVSGDSHESFGTTATAGSSEENPGRCRHPHYPSLDIDWIMRFKDDKLEAEYQRHNKENRHHFCKWIVYFTFASSLLPIWLQRDAIAGSYGFTVKVNQYCLILAYCIMCIIFFTIVSWSGSQNSKDSLLLSGRQKLKELFVVLSSIWTSLSLVCRTWGLPCKADETLSGMQFCNASQNGLLPSDGFVGILACCYWYQHLLPVSFSYTITSWLVGLIGISYGVYSATTESKVKNAWFGNSVLMAVYVYFPVILYRHEKKNMRNFLLNCPKIRLTKKALDAFNQVGAMIHVYNNVYNMFDVNNFCSHGKDDENQSIKSSSACTSSSEGSSGSGTTVSTNTFEEYWRIKQPIPKDRFRHRQD